MRKYRISCPILSKQLPSHERYRDELLALIEKSDGETIHGDNDIDIIVKTDFFTQQSRKFYEPLFVSLTQVFCQNIMSEFLDRETTEFKFKMNSLWYQQYQKNDTHHWHDHAYFSTMSAIYYLEFPRGTPGTEFVDPFTKRVHRPRVKEGDVLIFPSFVVHRSPPNKSNHRKTIISMNFV